MCGCLQLEEGHTGRLERTEDLWLRVRKDHAPRLARLSLESRSLRDVLLHGESLPQNPAIAHKTHKTAHMLLQKQGQNQSNRQ